MKRSKPLKRSRLNPISSRQAALNEIFAAAREERRYQARSFCEGATPACPPGLHPGVLAHHVRRRKGQPDVHAVEHLRWLCAPGHAWIHENPTAAKEKGLLA